MNAKNIIKKAAGSTLFWLCLTFALLYLMLGVRMIDTLVYDYDGLLFHTDTAEVAEDITEFQTRNHGDTNVHPLFVLFVNPLGSLLNSFLPVTIAVILINTLCGTLIIWTAYCCFLALGLPKYQSALWTILTGCTASNLLFVSIPERHIMASLSITVMCLLCIKYPGNVRKLVWAGIIALGVTVTNFVQCGIIFWLSTFHNKKDSENKFKNSISKTIQFGVATLILAVALSLLQKQIWPDTRYFFVPDVYEEETAFFRTPEDANGLAARALDLATHMFVYSIAAPETRIDLDGEFKPLTLDLEAIATYKPIGLIALSGWSLIFAMGLYLIFMRKHNKWFWLQAGILLCLLFNFLMHMIYGDDFFLYTVNWTVLLIIMIASAMVAGNKSKAFRLTVNTLLTLFVAATVINNAAFINDISGYFRYGGSTKWHNQHDKWWERATEMDFFLKKNDIHTLFSENKQKWLMAPFNNQISVVNVANEPSPKLKQEAELLSGNYAFLYDVGDVMTFIKDTMGSYETKQFDEFTYYYKIVPPLQPTELIDNKLITSISSSCDTNNTAAVVDRNLDTSWTGVNIPDKPDWIEFSFTNKVLISSLKILSKNDSYPMEWRVDIRESETNEWQAATSMMGVQGYFWSGPRLFWNGKQFSLEAGFVPTFASKLRVYFPPNYEGRIPGISEIMIYSPGDPASSQRTAMPLLIAELREKGIKKLYSERWVANAVHKNTSVLKGKLALDIETLLEPSIFEQQRSRKQPKLDRSAYPVFFSSDTAIVVSTANARSTRYCLNERGYKTRETTIGPWVMFDFRDCEWQDDFEGYSKLYWSGFTCLLANANGASKVKAKKLTADALRAKTNDSKLALLNEALSLYPGYQDALAHLSTVLNKEGKTNEVEAVLNELHDLRTPEQETVIDFGKSITLKGISTPDKTSSPGDNLNISYFWTYKPDKKRHYPYSVFVHFIHNGEIVFQGDHDLCATFSKEELLCQSKEEVFIEKLTHAIPENAPDGEYQIIIGVYDNQKKVRLKASPTFKIKPKRNSVRLPLTLKVEKKKAAPTK